MTKDNPNIRHGITYMPTQVHEDIKKLQRLKGVSYRQLALSTDIAMRTLVDNINGSSRMPVDRHEAVLEYLTNIPEGK